MGLFGLDTDLLHFVILCKRMGDLNQSKQVQKFVGNLVILYKIFPLMVLNFKMKVRYKKTYSK